MSWLSEMRNAWNLYREVKEKLGDLVPEAYALLDALEADDYEAASELVLSWRTFQEAIEELGVAKPYVPLVLPVLLRALDTVIPEEKIKEVLAGLGLTPPQPA